MCILQWPSPSPYAPHTPHPLPTPLGVLLIRLYMTPESLGAIGAIVLHCMHVGVSSLVHAALTSSIRLRHFVQDQR